MSCRPTPIIPIVPVPSSKISRGECRGYVGDRLSNDRGHVSRRHGRFFEKYFPWQIPEKLVMAAPLDDCKWVDWAIQTQMIQRLYGCLQLAWLLRETQSTTTPIRTLENEVPRGRIAMGSSARTENLIHLRDSPPCHPSHQGIFGRLHTTPWTNIHSREITLPNARTQMIELHWVTMRKCNARDEMTLRI
ncbi:uncharacterized protein N7511_004847 [Penicillium nucicola]|uniref:uncharacterized protein n=1 Tax=Penicillium nucicola TaxID=1850975 RepID=UPI002545B652|nr:uncharacterized protein N7511_004847 [Penicillium nucicola]KAJ5767231.1 hypothetical protein N7511_004847 [Penicillium nucicola]